MIGWSFLVKGFCFFKSVISKIDKRGFYSWLCFGEFEEFEIFFVEEFVKEFYDFIGYDMGDNLIYVLGFLIIMFLVDGG